MNTTAQLSIAASQEKSLATPAEPVSSKKMRRFRMGTLHARGSGSGSVEAQADFLVQGGECLSVRFRAIYFTGSAREEDREFSFLLPVLTKTPRQELFRLGQVELGFSFTAELVAPSTYRCVLRAANETEGAEGASAGSSSHSLFSAHFLAETDGEFLSHEEWHGKRSLGSAS